MTTLDDLDPVRSTDAGHTDTGHDPGPVPGLEDRPSSLPIFDVELADGSHVIAVTRLPDMLRWETVRADKGWPAMGDAPMLWSVFMAWAALKRDGLTASSWSTFSTVDAVDITAVGVTAGDPTNAGRSDVS